MTKPSGPGPIPLLLLLTALLGCQVPSAWRAAPSEPTAEPPAAPPSATAPEDPEIRKARRSLARLRGVLGPNDPVTLEATLRLARRYERAGRYSDAEPLLSQTIQGLEEARGPDDVALVSLLLELALVQLEQGRTEEVQPLLERAVAIAEAELPDGDPGRLAALGIAAALHLRQGNLGRSDELYETAAAMRGWPPAEPLDLSAPAGSQLDERRLREEIGADGERGNPARAIARLDREIEAHPDSAFLYGLRGEVYMTPAADGRALDFEAARADLERSIEIDPGSGDSYARIAQLYRNAGRIDEAVANYERVVELHPDAASTHMILGTLYESAGRSDAAIGAYENAVRLDASQAIARNNLAWMLAEPADASDEALDRALVLAREARELLPEDPSVADTLGWVLLRKGSPSEAIPLLEEAVLGYARAGLRQPGTHYRLALAYQETGDGERAIEELERALQVPSFPDRPAAAALLVQLRSR
jgi:tetratricopeptide (TPR) repeat protein